MCNILQLVCIVLDFYIVLGNVEFYQENIYPTFLLICILALFFKIGFNCTNECIRD